MIPSGTVLVVETEFIIALGIQSVLETLGATTILAGSASDAHHKAPLWSEAALAVIEIEQSKPELIDLARQISDRGIPVLGMSADSRLAHGVPELSGTPILIKPIPDEDLVAAIDARLVQKPLPDVT